MIKNPVPAVITYFFIYADLDYLRRLWIIHNRW